jgi:hypothetical protein
MDPIDRLYADPSSAPWYRKAWAVWRHWTARYTIAPRPFLTQHAWPTVGRGVITGRTNPALAKAIAESRRGAA